MFFPRGLSLPCRPSTRVNKNRLEKWSRLVPIRTRKGKKLRWAGAQRDRNIRRSKVRRYHDEAWSNTEVEFQVFTRAHCLPKRTHITTFCICRAKAWPPEWTSPSTDDFEITARHLWPRFSLGIPRILFAIESRVSATYGLAQFVILRQLKLSRAAIVSLDPLWMYATCPCKDIVARRHQGCVSCEYRSEEVEISDKWRVFVLGMKNKNHSRWWLVPSWVQGLFARASRVRSDDQEEIV